MLEHTRQTIYIGTGFVFSPQPVIDPSHALQFQQELANHGIVFSQTQMPAGTITLLRQTPPFEVRVQHAGPALGNTVVIAPAPWGSVDEYLDDAKTAYAAYGVAWPGQTLQVLLREITIRQLYDVAEDHAFMFLWERRLNAKREELTAFRRPVLGGGLRFHMVPQAPEDQSPETDVRIESSFGDPKKLFIELQMKWHTPAAVPELDPEPMVREADRFLAEEVVDFITGAV
jgi:hypothetical protein